MSARSFTSSRVEDIRVISAARSVNSNNTRALRCFSLIWIRSTPASTAPEICSRMFWNSADSRVVASVLAPRVIRKRIGLRNWSGITDHFGFLGQAFHGGQSRVQRAHGLAEINQLPKSHPQVQDG